jgi:predicted nucleotidyltransferase/uncharacterized protein (UPF0332 family)
MELDRILGSKVTVKTLRTLLRRPYQERFFKELVKEVGVGVGPLSSALRILVSQGLVEERIVGKQHFYKANLQNSFTRSLYNLFSVERKLEIPANLRIALDEFVTKLRDQAKANLLSVVLFGSVASGRAKPESDIDLLLVFNGVQPQSSEIRLELDSVSKFYQVLVQEHSFTRREFLDAYGLGDDLIINALAEGLVLHDDELIIPLLSRPLPRPSTAVAIQNLDEARKKIEDAKRNYRDESLDTAVMLLALAASFAARAYLILKGETPRSRHDLSLQIRKYSEVDAKLLDNLTRARNAAAHGSKPLEKETVWKMLKECEDLVRQALEQSSRLS